MKVKFFGEPNMLVKQRHRVRFETGFELKPVFRFDENGEFVTDDEDLIFRLKQKFDSVEVTDIEEQEQSADETASVFKCKKCGEGFESKGKFLAHSRKCGKVE